MQHFRISQKSLLNRSKNLPSSKDYNVKMLSTIKSISLKLVVVSFWTDFFYKTIPIAVVTLQTFYLGKHDLLTVYLGKLDFSSVTDFFPGNLPRENFIVWVLDMSRKQ